MNNTRATRVGLGLVAAGAVLAAAVVHAPAANALTGSARVTTLVTWAGGDCIYLHTPNVFDREYTGSGWQCSDTHELWWDRRAYPGEWIGVDPDISGTGVIQVSCSLAINGVMHIVDSAVRGDGHEATCLDVL